MKKKSRLLWGTRTLLQMIVQNPREIVQVNIWNTMWANPQEVYEAGYELINTISDHLYIIPTGGYDYLDNEYIYTIFEPNRFEIEETIYEVPKDSKQMLGASIFVWNDFCGTLDMGVSEYDIMDRVLNVIPYFSQKVWGTVNTLNYEEFTEYGRNALVINEEGYLEFIVEFREYTFNYSPKKILI